MPATSPDRPRPRPRRALPAWPSVAEHLAEHRRRLIDELVGQPEQDVASARERRTEAVRPA